MNFVASTKKQIQPEPLVVAENPNACDRSDAPITEIRPASGIGTIDIGEIWRYRELLETLVWRDIKVRYRQTLLGVVWVIGQPLLMVAIFTLVLQKVAGLSLDSGAPYPLFVFAGIAPWQFFANGVQNAGLSVLGSTQLVSKVYFPRLIVPAAPVAGGLIDFAVVTCTIIVIQLIYGYPPNIWCVVLLPLAIALLVCLTFGVGCWMAALNVHYRDVRVIMPFLLQFGMFATPVLYPVSRLPSSLQNFAGLNPMTGILGLFRSGLLGETLVVWHVIASVLAAATLFITGVLAFTRMERQFADIL